MRPFVASFIYILSVGIVFINRESSSNLLCDIVHSHLGKYLWNSDDMRRLKHVTHAIAPNDTASIFPNSSEKCAVRFLLFGWTKFMVHVSVLWSGF